MIYMDHLGILVVLVQVFRHKIVLKAIWEIQVVFELGEPQVFIFLLLPTHSLAFFLFDRYEILLYYAIICMLLTI